MGLAQLPTELYAAIIYQFEPEDVQQSVLALTRAVPLSPVPLHALFENVRLRRPEQILSLYLHLRRIPQHAAYVRTFALESWIVDADVLVNLFASLPDVREATLFIGPNFAPEHLEELFAKPRSVLKYLSLRFRPYVQRPTYLQFMKGAYFDSMLTHLSSWPRAELPVISIIQDPIDATMAPKETFAQPLIFFRLDPLSSFAASPYTSTVSHFRFRVPRRPVASYIARNSGALPRVELLDLATCNVNPLDIQEILGTLWELKYLILDGCPLVTQRVDALDAEGAEDYGQWTSLGQALAMAGLKIAKMRESKLQRWLETTALAEKLQELEVNSGPDTAHTMKRRKGRSKVAMSPFTLRTPASGGSGGNSSASSLQAGHTKRPAVQRIRILPPVPTLRSLTLTAPMITSGDSNLEERCSAARAAFELGWAEGLSTVLKKRSLLRTSWTNGTRIMRVLSPSGETDANYEDEREGFAGLEDVHDVKQFDIEDERCPLLCLAGPGRDGHHPESCSHKIGWEVFKDEL